MIGSGWWSTVSALSRLGLAVYGRNDLLTRQWIKHHPRHRDACSRILQYSRLSAITTSWFTTLRGHPPTGAERRNALLIGIMTPLYDDLMDEGGFTHEEILTGQGKGNPSLKTVRSILDELTHTCPDKSLFLRILQQSGTAQDHSLLQLQPAPLSTEKLVEITSEKGAAFTLIYRAILHHPLSGEEEEAITTLGLLLQLTNDLFDVYKDLKNGQQTLLTREDGLAQVRALWCQQLDLFRWQWQTLPFPEGGISGSLYQIAILLGRGQVALDQLNRLATVAGGQFRPRDHSRHALICDMENLPNLWASLSWARNWCLEKK